MQLKTIKLWQAVVLIIALPLIIASCDKLPVGPAEADPVPPPAPGTYMTFTDFRALHGGTGDVTVPAGTKKIRGVVISNSANEAAGNYRLQDESGSGIYFYSVVGSPVYSMGSVLEIDAAGAGILTLYNGDLELKSVPQAKVIPVAGSLSVTPRVTTFAEIKSNRNTWASSLVKVNNLTRIKLGVTNSTGTNYTVYDATDSLSLFVRTASGITVDTARRSSITGYVSIYNSTTQIGIRNATDIQ